MSTRSCLLSVSRLLASTTPYASRSITRVQPQRRNFTRSRPVSAALALQSSSQPTVLLHAPSLKDIEDIEYDVELLPSEEANIKISDSAAEQLRTISQRNNDQNVALRISVESGGCHGYQYKMTLAETRQPDDYVFSHPVIKPSNIVIDSVSMGLLKGSIVDFATELIGSSFRIAENPQSAGPGCGCGISWELKV